MYIWTAAVPPATTKKILWMNVMALAMSSFTVLGPPTAITSDIIALSALKLLLSILRRVLPLKYQERPMERDIREDSPVASPAPMIPIPSAYIRIGSSTMFIMAAAICMTVDFRAAPSPLRLPPSMSRHIIGVESRIIGSM